MADGGWSLLLSCEHGGNRVPDPWHTLFVGAEEALAGHRGYDLGIAPFARCLADRLRAPLHLAEVSRLLVELNRSPGHPALFSEFSRSLGAEERRTLLDRHYHPYRNALTAKIDRLLETHGRVCHLSLHSFTPELNGEVRNADIGLLYDPRRLLEQHFCLDWQQNIIRYGGPWRVRRNYPYRGAADGLVTSLRRRYPADCYVGIELELNQKWPIRGGDAWRDLQELMCLSLQKTLMEWNEVAT